MKGGEGRTRFDLKFVKSLLISDMQEVNIPTISEWTRGCMPYETNTCLIHLIEWHCGNIPLKSPTISASCTKHVPRLTLTTRTPVISIPRLAPAQCTRLMDAIPCLLLTHLSEDEGGGLIIKLFPIIAQQALYMQNLDLGSFRDLGVKECRELSDLVQKTKELRGLACGSRKLTSDALH